MRWIVQCGKTAIVEVIEPEAPAALRSEVAGVAVVVAEPTVGKRVAWMTIEQLRSLRSCIDEIIRRHEARKSPS